MKTPTVILSTLLAASLAAPAFAEKDATRAPTAQQQRMKTCNAEAKGKALKGDERRSFMSSCLKGQPTAAGDSPKQAAR